MIKPLFQNILINVNSTEASIHAVQYGILMAKLYHCNLKAVYVVDTATLKQLTLNKFFVEEESSEYESNLLSDGAGYLKYVEELAKEKRVPIETEVRKGAIWSEVITAAEEKDAGLILLGGWERDLPDQRDVLSTSYRKILLNARCSVLIVKEKHIEQLYKLA
ncbi:MAG: universal stress protein [Spirochaetaceae bacterium]|jgi:nucleotide-binding universal stress UspA family protein|nr:universal stress protein [Spirochaetaceae bacterium]